MMNSGMTFQYLQKLKDGTHQLFLFLLVWVLVLVLVLVLVRVRDLEVACAHLQKFIIIVSTFKSPMLYTVQGISK